MNTTKETPKNSAEETLALMKQAIEEATERLESEESVDYTTDELLEELCGYVEDYFKENK